jgi:3-phenylpropionate/cinnamic acid dioxygenase small subunit
MYASALDRRDFAAYSRLFANDASFAAVSGGLRHHEAHGVDEIVAMVEKGVTEYEGTMHFVGNLTVRVDGDRAAGETYCIAHHFYTELDKRRSHVMGIRYQDEFVRQNGTWKFASRLELFDWLEDRPLLPWDEMRQRPHEPS